MGKQLKPRESKWRGQNQQRVEEEWSRGTKTLHVVDDAVLPPGKTFVEFRGNSLPLSLIHSILSSSMGSLALATKAGREGSSLWDAPHPTHH